MFFNFFKLNTIEGSLFFIRFRIRYNKADKENKKSLQQIIKKAGLDLQKAKIYTRAHK